MSLGHCLTEIIATILAVRGVQTHVHGTQRELNLSASCLLSCLRSTQNNSNKISQTNNTTQTTQVQHHNPANNKPSPQLVIETPLEHLAQAPFSPAPALASKSSTRRQNVFIASPGFSSLLADRPLPALLPLPVALFLFPLPLLFPLSFLHLATSHKTSQWLEHANAELRSRRRRSFNRFLRIVRRRKSKCFFDVMVSRSRCCNSVASSQLCNASTGIETR
jgi:hypothetical protein